MTNFLRKLLILILITPFSAYASKAPVRTTNTKLGDVETLNTKKVEQDFDNDFNTLQDEYNKINNQD